MNPGAIDGDEIKLKMILDLVRFYEGGFSYSALKNWPISDLILLSEVTEATR